MLRSKSPTFAVFTLNSSGSSEHEVINSLSEAAKKYGWNLLIFNSIDRSNDIPGVSSEKCIFKLADFKSFSGAFITRNIMNIKSESDALLKELKKHKIPTVSVGYKSENCHSVIYDDCISFEKLIDHIIEEHGCKILNLVAGMRNNVFSQHRIDAFKRSLKKHNLEFDEKRMFYGEFWSLPTEKGMDEFFKSKLPLPDAFVCCNDQMALTVCAKLAEKKIRVPDDVIVTGYDGIDFAALNSPSLSTVKCDEKKLGTESAKMMKKILAGENAPKLKTIAPNIILAESCGCKNAESHNYNKYAIKTEDTISTYKVMNLMQQDMVTAISDISKVSEIKECIPTRQYFGANVWIMLNHSSYNNIFSNEKFTAANPFDSRMDTYYCSIDWNQTDYPTIKRSEYIPELNKILQEKFHSLIFTPITFGDEVFGYCVYPFSEDKNNIAKQERFAQTIGQCISLVRGHEQLVYMLERDLLTGSYNRRGFFSQLKTKAEELCSSNSLTYLTIHSVDMDNLKVINDTYGHSAGDFAIKTLVRAIRAAGGKKSIIARFGGDEFVIASFTSKQTENWNSDFKEKLHTNLDSINKRSGRPFAVSASCGTMIAEMKTFNENTVDYLMKEADDLMYIDKQSRKRNKSRS
mgnify:CR=1 FL=1